MVLDQAVTTLLLRDYAQVQRELEQIVATGRNSMVTRPHFLTPTIHRQNLPWDNQSGEFQYYRNIRDVLEMALTQGYVSKKECDFSPPPYLQVLIG